MRQKIKSEFSVEQGENMIEKNNISNNKIFDLYGDYLSTLNQKKLYNFICKHLIDDEEFISIIDETIAPKKLKDLSIKDRKDEFKYFLHNAHRSFILNVILLKYLSNEFTKNSFQFLDEFWQEKFNKLKIL